MATAWAAPSTSHVRPLARTAVGCGAVETRRARAAGLHRGGAAQASPLSWVAAALLGSALGGAAASTAGQRRARPGHRARRVRRAGLAGAGQGMRLPAEWAPHERTLICWPSLSELSRGTPRDDLGMEGKDWIQEVHYRELRGLIEAASRYELVSVVVSAEDVEECATQLDGLTNIELLTHEHVNLWLRDVGPSFLLSPDSGRSPARNDHRPSDQSCS